MEAPRDWTVWRRRRAGELLCRGAEASTVAFIAANIANRLQGGLLGSRQVGCWQVPSPGLPGHPESFYGRSCFELAGLGMLRHVVGSLQAPFVGALEPPRMEMNPDQDLKDKHNPVMSYCLQATQDMLYPSPPSMDSCSTAWRQPDSIFHVLVEIDRHEAQFAGAFGIRLRYVPGTGPGCGTTTKLVTISLQPNCSSPHCQKSTGNTTTEKNSGRASAKKFRSKGDSNSRGRSPET